MIKSKKKLGEILIASGLINNKVLEKALKLQKESGKKLGEVLVDEGFVSNQQIVYAIKNQLGIECINLNNINVKQEIIDIIPENIARKHEVIPIDIINGRLLVAMSDPLNYFSIEDIKNVSSYAVKPAIALRDSIIENIEKYYGKNRAEEAAKIYDKTHRLKKELNEFEEEGDKSAPIIKFINTIIDNAVLNNASDIHLEPEENELRVRYRIDGLLREIMRVNVSMLEPVISRIKLLADLNIAERRIPQDGKILFKSIQKNIDIRVSIMPSIWGESAVMRLLDKSSFYIDIGNIGIRQSGLETLKKIISKPNGILLLCGPTGSGKTTTLYSILNTINNESKKIITIEDPVEYNMPGINQMQVNNKIGFDFAAGLRSILRQDPDVILIGEIRDNETAEIAIRAALTGHLVLTTIHTSSAISSITRLKDMGIKPFLLSATISGIISQRLVKKICPNCLEEYISDETEMKLLNIEHPVKLKKAIGCSNCNNTGYKGRIGVFEVLEIDKELKALIDKDESEVVIEKKIKENGVNFLKDACIDKVLSGITTIEELIRVTYGY